MLQNAFQNSTPITLTGSQVGSAYNFVPDTAINMPRAQGDILLDSKMDPNSVKATLIHTHEMAFHVRLDQHTQFDQIGHTLIFANNLPFLWNISEIPFSKLYVDPTTHFAGDRYIFSTVMRYPYIRNLVTYDPNNGRHAKFPVYGHIYQVVEAAHEQCDQISVEKNDLWFGQGNPFIAHRFDNAWYSSPLMRRLDKNVRIIDGGTTKTGY